MKQIIAFILLTSLSSFTFAQCNSGEVEVEIVVHTDEYGYEGYWELTPSEDSCGQNTIASGGNDAVGCNGAGDQNQDQGGYGDNLEITEGPWCLIEGAMYDIHYMDDWGDGGFSFDVLVNGYNVVSFDGVGLGATFTFVANEPPALDLMTFGLNLNSYIELGTYTLVSHVFNAGTSTISDYNLNYSLNDGPPVIHAVSDSELSNYETEEVEHSIPLEISSFGLYTIKMWASDLNGDSLDENPGNDTLIKVIEAGPGIPNIIDTYVGAGFTLEQVAGAGEQIDRPTDLDFHPVLTNKELWITNKGIESDGGSTVTIYDAGEETQSSIYKQDGNAWHFMSLPTGIAFSDNGNFATSPGVYDANHNGGSAFTGPSLWSSDMSIYAEPSGGNGSHLDMLHASPNSQGIAAEKDNVFWVFDGYTHDIVRYDFQEDHGPGNSFHGDAIIRRFSDDEVLMDSNEEIVSHLVLHENMQWLYVVDHGNGRVIRIDITTGSDEGGTPNYSNPEEAVEYSEYTGYTQETVVTGLVKPSGIDVIEDRMLVAHYETGEIWIYDITSIPAQLLHVIPTGLSSIQGVKIGPEGRIWFVDYDTDGVYVLESGPVNVNEIEQLFGMYPNPTKDLLNITTKDQTEINSIHILDRLGREVLAFGRLSNRTQIDLSNLAPGVYEISVTTLSSSGTQSLIIE